MKKFNGMTSSLMANGLYRFYDSFAIFTQKCIEADSNDGDDDDDDRALKMEQLRRPMMLVFGLWAVAVVLFVAEVIVKKWKSRRNCNDRPRPQNRIALHSAPF